MNVAKNAVLESSGTLMFEGQYRLVGLTNDGGALLIKMKKSTKAPIEVEYEDLCNEIELDRIKIVEEPTIRGMPTSLKELRGKSKLKYDLAAKIIAEVEQENASDDSWMAADRLTLRISLAAKKLQQPRIKVARVVYRWLAGAQSDLAVADRNKTGFRSKKLQNKGKKRGRPYAAGHFEVTKKAYSLPNSEATRKKLQEGAKEFYDPTVRNFSDSYDLTLKEHFSHFSRGRKILNRQLPSKTMYRQEIERLNSEGKALFRRKVGEREFGRNHRGLASKESKRAPGPTYIFQVDATFPKLDCVDELDRSKVLGPVTIYLALDAWDGVIVGEYATYQPDSMDVASTALFYTFSDKYEGMKQAGEVLKPGEYDLHHVCHRLYADRGVLRSQEGDQFVRSIGLRMVTVLAERADLKGTVEKCHHLLEQECLAMVKGFRGKIRGKNGRPSATLPEVRKALKRVVLKLNLRPAREIPKQLKKLPKNGRFTRLDHHHWGLKNIRGAGHTWPAKDLYLKLMPQEPCSLSRGGIMFKGQQFSSDELVKTGITAVITKDRITPAKVCYDRNDFSRVWLVHPQLSKPMECENMDERIRKARCALETALAMLERDKHSAAATEVATQQVKSELSAKNRKMFAEAEKKARDAQRNVSAAEMMRNKKVNRIAAEAIDRAQQAAAKAKAAGVGASKVAKEATAVRLHYEDALKAKRRALAEKISKGI